jgi:hypothetical protein
MRLGIVAVFAIALPLLAACSNDQAPKPAAETPAAKPAVTAPAATTPAAKPASTAKVPAGAEPLIGTWAASLSSCGDAKAVTTITATSYASPAGSCDISLKASKDGFSTACGSAQMTLTPVFAPSGEGVNVVGADGKRQTILRCTKG